MRTTSALALVLALTAIGSARAEDSGFDPGGALRLNYGWKDYDRDDKFDLELVRVELACERGRFICSAQYRWYEGFSALHHAWVGVQATDDSVQNVTGCSFAKGVMFTYVDWIAGRNMWFAGGPGIGVDEGDSDSDRWHSRLNVNVGFYF